MCVCVCLFVVKGCIYIYICTDICWCFGGALRGLLYRRTKGKPCIGRRCSLCTIACCLLVASACILCKLRAFSLRCSEREASFASANMPARFPQKAVRREPFVLPGKYRLQLRDLKLGETSHVGFSQKKCTHKSGTPKSKVSPFWYPFLVIAPKGDHLLLLGLSLGVHFGAPFFGCSFPRIVPFKPTKKIRARQVEDATEDRQAGLIKALGAISRLFRCRFSLVSVGSPMVCPLFRGVVCLFVYVLSFFSVVGWV